MKKWGAVPFHISGVQGPYAISQRLVWISRDLFVLVSLHFLKETGQILLTDLQLGPLKQENGEQKWFILALFSALLSNSKARQLGGGGPQKTAWAVFLVNWVPSS